MNTTKTRSLLLSILTGLALGLGLLAIIDLYRHPPSPTPSTYASAVSRAQPSVVDILGLSNPTNTNAENIWENPLLSEYQDRIVVAENPTPRLGSGIVWNDSGAILTNYHVVKAVDALRVRNILGQEAEAQVVAFDPESDLAVLQAKGLNIPAIPLSEDPVKVGDIVLALGNSFGVGQAVTQGIVSALERHNIGLARLENFIQTDAAINPGQSGGALINTAGELVGITTGVFSSTGNYQGISFAIPASEALMIAQELLTHGRIIRPYLGITLRPLSETESRFFGPYSQHALLITEVDAQGPSAAAGLKPGDVLVGLDSRKPPSSADMQKALNKLEAGSEHTFTIIRLGERQKVFIQVGAR